MQIASSQLSAGSDGSNGRQMTWWQTWLAELTSERLNVKVHNACEREDEDRGDSPVESLREVAELARHEADRDDRAAHHEPAGVPATVARPHRHLQVGEELQQQ